jgi:hypothetical protein
VILFGIDQVQALHQADYYHTFLISVLVIGIYCSVYGIDVDQLAKDKISLIIIVTIGVCLKVGIIGGVFFLTMTVLDNVYPVIGLDYSLFLSIVFAVAVAQIDPLSVGALLTRHQFLSERAKRFLFVWSSFDDPMTVVIAAILTAFIISDGSAIVLGQNQLVDDAFLEAAKVIGFNLIVSLIAFGVSFIIHSLLMGTENRVLVMRNAADLCILAAVILCSVIFELILATAIAALFVRPKLSGFVDLVYLAVAVAYIVALILLGTHIATTVFVQTDVLQSLLALATAGAVLGVASVFSQIATATLFTRQLENSDRIYLRWAQQNGITAVILALLFSQAGYAAGDPQLISIVSIVTVAIFAINLIHLVSFQVIDLDNIRSMKNKE